MITCKLTGKNGKSVKAHIIPRSFIEKPPQEEGLLRLMNNEKGTFPKNLPAGIYNETIVTIKGERHFGAWDDYASKVLFNRWGEFEEIRNNKKMIWSLS